MSGADHIRGNKPWKLGEDETFSSFSTWKNITLFNLRKEKEYQPFLKEGEPVTWQPFSAATPKRGLDTQSAADNLNCMLRFIASYTPDFLHYDIENTCTSLDKVWHHIRGYYRFEKSEVRFMNLLSIVREENERPQRLYHRVLAHLQDNLLTKDSNTTHDGKVYDQNEAMTPTIERWAVLHWMQLIHPRIPALVKRSFATDLQKYSLKELQPRIADAIDGFLDEINRDDHQADRIKTRLNRVQSVQHDDPDSDELEEYEDVHVARAGVRPRYRNRQGAAAPNRHHRRQGTQKHCVVCKLANKPYFHSTKDCEILHAIRSLKVLEDLADLDIDEQE